MQCSGCVAVSGRDRLCYQWEGKEFDGCDPIGEDSHDLRCHFGQPAYIWPELRLG